MINALHNIEEKADAEQNPIERNGMWYGHATLSFTFTGDSLSAKPMTKYIKKVRLGGILTGYNKAFIIDGRKKYVFYPKL